MVQPPSGLKIAVSSPSTEAAATASDGKKALFYCSLLALQYGLQPILAKKFQGPNASKNSIVMATELSKVLIGTSSLLSEAPEVRQQIAATWAFKDFLKAAALPAALYAAQNLLMQFGYASVDAMTLNLLNQTKTLSAAFFLYLLMGKKQSGMQLFALILLLAAAVVLTSPAGSNPLDLLSGMSLAALSPATLVEKASGIFSSGSGGDSSEGMSSYSLGILAVSLASLISGISTALTQRVLSRGRNAIFFSSELAVVGITVLLIGDTYQHGRPTALALEGPGSFSQWTWPTLIPVLSNACGGIIVGLVTKYAGGVTKGFALIAGILVTGLAEFVVDGTPMGSRHAVSTALVCTAIYLHNTFQYRPPAAAATAAAAAKQKKKN